MENLSTDGFIRIIHAVEQVIRNDNVPGKCSVIRGVRDCVACQWGIIDLLFTFFQAPPELYMSSTLNSPHNPSRLFFPFLRKKYIPCNENGG